MLAKLLIVISLVAGALLVIILNSSTPATAGAFGILVVFVCAYLFLLSVLTFLLYGISRVIDFAKRIIAPRKVAQRMSLKKAYYYSTVLALAPVIIISMQSIGGTGPYEVGLIFMLVSVGCLYVTKRTS